MADAERFFPDSWPMGMIDVEPFVPGWLEFCH
jgi:hypothetical protein